MAPIAFNPSAMTPVSTGNAPAVTPTSADVGGTGGNSNLTISSKTYTPTAPGTDSVTGSNNPTGSKDPTSSNTTTAFGMTFYVDKDGYIYTDKECTNYIALNQADLEAWCRANKKNEVEAYELENLPTVTPQYKSWDDLDKHLDTLSTFRGTKTFTYKQGDYVYSCKVYWLNDITGQKYSGNNKDGGAYRMNYETTNKPIGKSI